jgi:hypothetical protein
MKSATYKNVFHSIRKNGAKADIEATIREPWTASLTINGVRVLYRRFETEVEAARAVDLALIRAGRQPVNVLKPKG